jgi:DNA mismatch repair protein MutS2
MLSVQVGSFRVEVPAAAVQPVPKREVAGGVGFSGGGTAGSTLDLRGQRVEEALLAVERHLDAALLAGLNRVDIIHGYGTGALREAVREYLAGCPRVKSFRSGGPGKGAPA